MIKAIRRTRNFKSKVENSHLIHSRFSFNGAHASFTALNSPKSGGSRLLLLDQPRNTEIPHKKKCAADKREWILRESQDPFEPELRTVKNTGSNRPVIPLFTVGHRRRPIDKSFSNNEFREKFVFTGDLNGFVADLIGCGRYQFRQRVHKTAGFQGVNFRWMLFARHGITFLATSRGI